MAKLKTYKGFDWKDIYGDGDLILYFDNHKVLLQSNEWPGSGDKGWEVKIDEDKVVFNSRTDGLKTKARDKSQAANFAVGFVKHLITTYEDKNLFLDDLLSVDYDTDKEQLIPPSEISKELAKFAESFGLSHYKNTKTQQPLKM